MLFLFPPPFPVVVQCSSAPILRWGGQGLLALMWVWGRGAVSPVPYLRVGGGGRDALCPPPSRGRTPAIPIPYGQTLLAPWLGAALYLWGSSSRIPGVWGGGGVSTHPCAPHCDPQPPPPPRAKTPLSCRSSSPPACSPNLTSTAHPVPVSINPQQWGGWGGRGGPCFIGLKPPCPPPPQTCPPANPSTSPTPRSAPRRRSAAEPPTASRGALKVRGVGLGSGCMGRSLR